MKADIEKVLIVLLNLNNNIYVCNHKNRNSRTLDAAVSTCFRVTKISNRKKIFCVKLLRLEMQFDESRDY